jgi:hypothetical protein
MAQTTSGLSWVAAKVEMSTNGTTWTDMSGWETAVAVSGGERMTGETYTTDGDTPIITAGKRGPVDLTVRYVYTEVATDPFKVALDAYETAGGGAFYVRYSPKGGAVGDYQYTVDTLNNVLVQPGYPMGEAGSADAILGEIVLKTAKLTRATVT